MSVQFSILVFHEVFFLFISSAWEKLGEHPQKIGRLNTKHDYNRIRNGNHNKRVLQVVIYAQAVLS